MLSDETRARRRGKVTATIARDIMNAQSDAELNLIFDRATDALPPEPENYAMRAGAAMEPVIINEFELRTGERLTRRQEFVDHPTIKDFGCTLDGWHASQNRVVECKFASPFMSRDELFRLYYPQVAFQMACVDAVDGVLVIGQGTTEPFEIECVRDLSYEIELLQRCAEFLACMQTMTPPCARPPAPVPPERWRTIDISKDNVNWAGDLIDALTDYGETADAALAHAAANQVARSLVPDDVGKVIAGIWTLTRNRKGIISIRRAA